MGVSESKKNKQKDAEIKPRLSGTTKENTQNDIKDVLLLYRASNKKQRNVIRSFEDTLVRSAKGQINIYEKVDIAKDAASVKGLEWLCKQNNVILILLSPDAVEYIQRIIREKRFIDERGVLNDKIIAVSFGRNLPDDWPKHRRTTEKKDFCFEFEDEDELTDNDFESNHATGKINALIRALAAAH